MTEFGGFVNEERWPKIANVANIGQQLLLLAPESKPFSIGTEHALPRRE